MSGQSQLLSIDILAQELVRRGYKYEEKRFGQRFVEFIAPDGWMWLTTRGLISYPFVSFAARKISDQKELAYAFASQLQVTIPQTLLLSKATPDGVAAFLKKYAPVVVKPTNSHGSSGVTLGVSNMEALQAAINIAHEQASDVLLQQQVHGQEVRITVIEGAVESVILRQTPQVVGDGVSTVEQLIQKENQERGLLHFKYITYPRLDQTLIDEGVLHSQEVPSAGEVVELSKSTLIRDGASLYDITDVVHNGYKQLAMRLAHNLNPEFLVVDFMIHDFTQVPSANNYAFLECNIAPSFKVYYSLRNGKSYDITAKLADMIDQRKGPTG